ncbi:MAG: hypothetical protein PARBA_01480 [Parabacteroides sp.]
MITQLYRTLISEQVRQSVYNAFLGDFLSAYRRTRDWLRCKGYYLYYSVIKPETEKEQAFWILGKTGPTPFPYLWKKEYDRLQIDVAVDAENGLPYVYHKGKRLYFRRDMFHRVSGSYKELLMEQDSRCAHRYVESYQELKGKTLLDIGCAEAIFTLDTIEEIDHAYLFECNEGWIEALQATFAPWKEKVTIVRKYVSDMNDENNVTLDDYFKDKPSDNLFLKMDIEGYERKALRGASCLLSKAKNISGSVCVYHLSDDVPVIQGILREHKLETTLCPGYLYVEKEMRPAVMRFK